MSDAGEGFREIVEKADVGIVLIDPEKVTVNRTNDRFLELIGYDRGAIDGMSVLALTADDPRFDGERATGLIEEAMAGHSREFDWLLACADGSQLWVEVSIQRAEIGDERQLLAFVRDASDRKQRQQELEKFQEIYDNADEAIGLCDPETGTITEANPKFAEILGYEQADMAGTPIAEATPSPTEFGDVSASVIEDAMAGETQSLDCQLERKDGSTLWAAVSLKRAPIGDVDRLLVFFRDVTDRKAQESELERHRSEMEFFNSLLRHDVLNAVTVIRTHGSHLADALDGEEEAHAETVVEWADNVTEVVERVRNVIETLTGEGETSYSTIDLSATLRRQIDRLEGGYPDVTVRTDVPADVHVMADDLLGEVLGNVLTNAVDHNPEADLVMTVTVEPGPDVVTVEIADTGAGIADEDKEAVFRRGQTGHVKNTGSGFGLFFVDSMIDAYGGTIRVEDNEPTGAVVVMELPTASG